MVINRPKVFRFKLAPWTFTVIQDGSTQFRLGEFFPGLGGETAEEIRDKFGLVQDVLPLSINILLAENGRQKLLVDTGLGRDIGSGEGRLLESLARLGITPGAVDAVVITHGHWDHIGMIADDTGGLCFPNARHFMPAGEWEFWTAEENLERVGDPYAAWARQNLPALAGSIQTVGDEIPILPGVRLLQAPGHTIHQAAVLFEGEKGRLLHIADAFHHPFQIHFPQYSSAADQVPQASPGTRRMLLEEAAGGDVTMLGYHFPFPGLGTVDLQAGLPRWSPLEEAPRKFFK